MGVRGSHTETLSNSICCFAQRSGERGVVNTWSAWQMISLLQQYQAMRILIIWFVQCAKARSCERNAQFKGKGISVSSTVFSKF